MFGKFRLVDFSLERLRFLLDRVGLGYLIVTPRMEAKTSLYCATEPSLDEPQFSGQVTKFLEYLLNIKCCREVFQ